MCIRIVHTVPKLFLFCKVYWELSKGKLLLGLDVNPGLAEYELQFLTISPTLLVTLRSSVHVT